MKQKFIYLIATALCLLLSACSSHEEPGDEYTGPWLIEFYEEFRGIHNDSEAFHSWFDKYENDLIITNGGFLIRTDTETFKVQTVGAGDNIKDLYPISRRGFVRWNMRVVTAKLKDVNSIIDEFESLTIDDINHYNMFSASLYKLDEGGHFVPYYNYDYSLIPPLDE